ncbi:MAG TPA: hypothetical protein VKB46_00965 [Pyrinomonadaceae bacterium]|nr:hypothetical protein [Pyrinomonadaceae bacterium]
MKTMTKLETVFCASGLLERPRYFPRQLITPVEMTLEQNYFRDKMRRHNRLLHGWGVVCGAQVCLVPRPDQSDAEPWKIAVHPGYILSPFGDEILIDQERVVDLRTEGLISICGQPAGEVADPWCSDVFIRRQEENGDVTLYVAVKYKEVLTRPVRTQPASCGCSDTQCEFSRFCDGYEIGVLNHCPESHENPPNVVEGSVNLETLVTGKLPECPECPTDPWVVLARVKVNSDGVIQEIDNCSCRRIVISFGRFWWRCASDMIGSIGVSPTELKQGDTDQALTITGTNLISDPLPTVSLGSRVKVKEPVMSTPDGKLTVIVDVDLNAATGPRNLRVTKPDCSTAVTQITIVPKPTTGPTNQPEPQQRAATKPPPSKKVAERKGGKG